MVIQKGNMTIQLEENIDKLNTEIQELLKVKKLLIQSSSFKLLYGKTQAGEEKEFDSIRSRLEHSLNIAKISQRIVSEIYDNCATEEQKTTEKNTQQFQLPFALLLYSPARFHQTR